MGLESLKERKDRSKHKPHNERYILASVPVPAFFSHGVKTCEKKVGVETGNKAKVSYTTIDTKREVKPCSGRQ